MEKHQHKIGYPLYRTINFLPKFRGKHESATMDKDLPYNRVAHLLRRVRDKRGSYLSAGDLERLGIKLFDMDIETGRPADSGPQFCEPYPSQEFDNVFEKVSADLRLGEDEKDVYVTAFGIGMLIEDCLRDLEMFYFTEPSDRRSTYYARSRNSTIIEQRLDCVDRHIYGEPNWQTSSIFESYDKSIPHRGCALHDGAVSDDRLRRSEVFCAAALMAAKLPLAKKTEGGIVPVFIYSFAGYKARVIQAHYEHPHFIVRKTEHFEFEEGSVRSFKLMLRWMMNTPKGDVGSAKHGYAHKLLGFWFAGGK